MASFKIAALQKALDGAVPAADLEIANKQYTELTEKYRDLLDRSNTLVVRNEASQGFEVCLLLFFCLLLFCVCLLMLRKRLCVVAWFCVCV